MNSILILRIIWQVCNLSFFEYGGLSQKFNFYFVNFIKPIFWILTKIYILLLLFIFRNISNFFFYIFENFLIFPTEIILYLIFIVIQLLIIIQFILKRLSTWSSIPFNLKLKFGQHTYDNDRNYFSRFYFTNQNFHSIYKKCLAWVILA